MFHKGQNKINEHATSVISRASKTLINILWLICYISSNHLYLPDRSSSKTFFNSSNKNSSPPVSSILISCGFIQTIHLYSNWGSVLMLFSFLLPWAVFPFIVMLGKLGQTIFCLHIVCGHSDLCHSGFFKSQASCWESCLPSLWLLLWCLTFPVPQRNAAVRGSGDQGDWGHPLGCQGQSHADLSRSGVKH